MNRIVLFICLIFLVSLTGCVYFGFQGRIEPGYTPTYYVAPNGHGVGVYEYDPEEMMIAVGKNGKIRRLAAERENVYKKRTFYVIPANVLGKLPYKVEVWSGEKQIKVRREHGRWAFDLVSRKDRSDENIDCKVSYRDNPPIQKPGPASDYVDSTSFHKYNCFSNWDPACVYEWGP